MKRENIYNLTELLIVGSVTTVGFLIGGTVGVSVIAGLGINLGSNILDKGSSKLKSKWLDSKDGILNHDIQRALLRAFEKSINEIEKEYFELESVTGLSSDNKKAITQFFKTINDSTKSNFNLILSDLLDENKIQIYLSKEPEKAENELWEKMSFDTAFEEQSIYVQRYYDDFYYNINHLKEYLKQNLHHRIKHWFSEELKTDSKENNKAWRAFQRLLLEGIKEDINSLNVGQAEIKSDLEKLDKIEKSINKLKDSIDTRLPNEPFYEDFKKGTQKELDKILATTEKINATSINIESKVDLIIDKLDKTEQEQKINAKKVNTKLKPLLKKIKDSINKNDYDKAEVIYNKARNIDNLDDYSNAKLNIKYAHILRNKYFDIKSEDKILMECLGVFEKYEIKQDIIAVKELLTQSKSNLKDFNSAVIFANDLLENATTDVEKANAHIFIGTILIQKNDLSNAKKAMDKAIEFGNKLTLKSDGKLKTKGLEIITFASHNNSLILKWSGKIKDAKISSIKAIQGLRELEDEKKLGQALFELAELEIFDGNFSNSKWSEYIEEAKSIFRELKDFSWLARCYDLVAKIAFTSNEPELALSIFEEGFLEIQKTKDKNGIAHFLGKFVSFYIHQKDFENAKESLSKYSKYAKKNNIERALKEIKEFTLRIAEIEGDTVIKEEHLTNLINDYEKEYNNEQSETTKAFILGKIASIYEEQNELILALNTFKKVATKYKKLEIDSEYAKSLLMINQLKIKLGYRDGLLDTWQEVLNILDGTNYHSLIAIANINCGSYLLETRNLEQAQRYLETAEFYVLKYKLPNKEDVERLLKEVRDRLDFKKPVEYSFEHIVNRLYFGINKNKSVFNPLLRYWYYRYQEDIIKHFTNKSGLNNIFFSDNIKYINQFTKNTSWLFSYYLIASNETFQKGNLDVFESPFDGMEKGEQIMVLNSDGIKKDKKISLEKQLLESLNKPQKNGNISRYVHFPVKEKDWKEMKIFIGGNSIGLPSLTYDFFKKNNAKSILESNYFWLHFDRYTLKDKLFTDTILCWEMKYFPVYLNEHLTSKKITTLSKVIVKIPFQIEFDKSKANEIKKLFNSLFRIENSNAKTELNDFKFDIDILTENIENTLSLSISIVEVQHSAQKFTYPIIIINE